MVDVGPKNLGRVSECPKFSIGLKFGVDWHGSKTWRWSKNLSGSGENFCVTEEINNTKRSQG